MRTHTYVYTNAHTKTHTHTHTHTHRQADALNAVMVSTNKRPIGHDFGFVV